jgi:hypothetical protein
MSDPMSDAEVDELLERFDLTAPGLQRKIVARLVAERAAFTVALQESVKLQSHYAALLNGDDGGRRIGFADAQAWLDRLAELKRIPIAVKV